MELKNRIQIGNTWYVLDENQDSDDNKLLDVSSFMTFVVSDDEYSFLLPNLNRGIDNKVELSIIKNKTSEQIVINDIDTLQGLYNNNEFAITEVEKVFRISKYLMSIQKMIDTAIVKGYINWEINLKTV